jgi:hypothetical protein
VLPQEDKNVIRKRNVNERKVFVIFIAVPPAASLHGF